MVKENSLCTTVHHIPLNAYEWASQFTTAVTLKRCDYYFHLCYALQTYGTKDVVGIGSQHFKTIQKNT